mgnify:CR=1 FL=1
MNAYVAWVRMYRRLVYALRYGRQKIYIDPTSYVSGKSRIRVQGGGSIVIGKGCEIHDFAMILTYGGDISFGDHCSLNPFSIVYGHGGVRIGDGVRIAAHSIIVPGNHNQTVDGEPMHTAGTTMQGIDIADHVWLGAGVRVLDGVTIGSNAVVGAGSVVTRSVPENATVGGVPARLIKQR